MPNRTYYTAPGAVPADIDTREDVVSTWCCLEKGYTPPPFKLENDEDNGQVKVVFEPNPFSSTCKCQIECVAEGLAFDGTDSQIGKFCPEDEDFQVVLSSLVFTDGQPTVLAFSFEDVSGNVSTLEIPSIVTVVPKSPLAHLSLSDDDRRSHVVVAVPLYSRTFYDLRDTVTQYQIERYIRNTTNKAIWVDWTNVGERHQRLLNLKDRVHWDRDIATGVDYGYRVRFRTAFDNASLWSSWTTARG